MKKFMMNAAKTAGSFVLACVLLGLACVLVPVKTIGCIANVLISMLDDASNEWVNEYVQKKMRKLC